jgi:hypothetical protein
MAVLQCYVDDETLQRLQAASADTGRAVEDLAESAISETALAATRDRELPQPWGPRHG